MTDQPQKPSYTAPLYLAVLVLLAILPVLTVNSTSLTMRISWLSILLMLCFVGFTAYMRTKGKPDLPQRGPYARRYGLLVFGTILGALLIAETLAVAATYATPERPLLWQTTMLISSIGDAVLPLIGKYATQMEPPLEPEVLYKVQTVTTLFLLAGAIIVIVFAPYTLCMPHEESLAIQKATARFTKDRSATTKLLIFVPFGIYCGLALFNGWFEFDPDPAYLTHKKCFMKAACYVHDDLLLLATGYMRILGSYGAWLGSLMFLLQVIDE